MLYPRAKRVPRSLIIKITGFEIAVKEGGARSLMAAYNQINGVYANESKYLLQDILRDE